MSSEQQITNVFKKLDEHFSLTYIGYVPENKFTSLKVFFDNNSAKNIQKTYETEIIPEANQKTLATQIDKLVREFRNNANTDNAIKYPEKKLMLTENYLKDLFKYCVYLESFSVENISKINKKRILDFSTAKPALLNEGYEALLKTMVNFLEIAKAKCIGNHKTPISLLFVIYYISDFLSRHIKDEKLKQISVYTKIYSYSVISYDCFVSNFYKNISNDDLEKWVSLNLLEIKNLSQGIPNFKSISNEIDSRSLSDFFKMIDFLNQLGNINKTTEPEKLKQALTSVLSETNLGHISDMLRKKQNLWAIQIAAMTARIVSMEILIGLISLEKTQSHSFMSQNSINNGVKNLIQFWEYEVEFIAQKYSVDLNDPLEMLFIADTSPEIFDLLSLSKMFEILLLYLNPDVMEEDEIKSNSTENNLSFLAKTAENIHWLTSPKLWYKYFSSIFCPPAEPENEEDSSLDKLTTSILITTNIFKNTQKSEEKNESEDFKKSKWYSEINEIKQRSSQHPHKISFSSNSSSSSSSNSSTSNKEDFDEEIEKTPEKLRGKFQPNISKKLQKYLDRSKKVKDSSTQDKNTFFEPLIFRDKICFRHIPNTTTHLPMYAGVSYEIQQKIANLIKEKGKDKIQHPKMTRAAGGQGIKLLTEIEKNKIGSYFDDEYSYKLKFLGKDGEIRFLGKKMTDPRHPNIIFILFDQEVAHDLKPVKNKHPEILSFSALAKNNIHEETRRKQTRNSNAANYSNSSISENRKNISQ